MASGGRPFNGTNAKDHYLYRSASDLEGYPYWAVSLRFDFTLYLLASGIERKHWIQNLIPQIASSTLSRILARVFWLRKKHVLLHITRNT